VEPNEEGGPVGATEDRLWKMIEPYVTAEGIELDDLEVLGQGPRRIVRVTVDGDEPVDVDHIARLSRGIGRLLDEQDPLPDAYTLEVGSPGLERSLRRPRHFAKAIERTVKVKTYAPIEGAKNHTGTLTEVGDGEITVDIDGTPRVIAFDDIASAKTVFVWESGATPDRRRDSRKGTA
jgi:ribosome maturation factor RimP